MPELPEVEIQVQQLLPRLRGAIIRQVELPDPKLRLPARLKGCRIRHIWRRGKFIIFDLDDGRHLQAHLRLTGEPFTSKISEGSESCQSCRRVSWRNACDRWGRSLSRTGVT